MPGVLSGLVAGIEANRETALRQQQLGIEKTRVGIEQQRASLEQAQVERQNRRQDLMDKLDANHQEISDLMLSAAPDRAVVAQAPPAPTGTRPTDPAAAAQWDAAQQKHDAYVNSDQYKSAVNGLNQAIPKFQELAGKHRAHLGQLAGEYTAEVNDEFPRTDFNIAHGNLDGVSGRELGNWYLKKYGLPAEHWAIDPKTGTSQAQQDALQIQQGLQSGQWDGKEAAVSALFPELHMALGQQLPNGNVVTAAQATHIGYDPKDPNYLLIGHALRHTDEQGNHGVVHSPALAEDGLRVPVREVQRRVGEFFNGVNLSQRPDVQAKLGNAVMNGDTAYHEFLKVAGAAGVPPPQREYKEVPAFGSLVDVTPGQAPTVVAEGQQRPPSGITGEATRIQAEAKAQGIDMPFEEALDRANESMQNRKAPPADGGAAAGALIDARRQRAADLAYRGAVAQRAREKGYLVDKDGNLKYGSSDESGKYAKGDAVNDPEFEAEIADLRQASDESAQAGKPLTASQLIAKARQRKPAAAATPGSSPDSPLPFPASPEAAVKGAHYQTAKGVMVWDGQNFVPPGGVAPISRDAAQAPSRTAPAVAAAAAPRKDAQPGADQGAAIRRLADSVNYADYVKSGPSGAKRDIDSDITGAEGALQALQTSMVDKSLPESVRGDMQHRFAAELMRLNELRAVKAKLND